MEKSKVYTAAEIDIVSLSQSDVIATSNEWEDDNAFDNGWV